MSSLRQLKVTFDSFEDLVENIGPGLSRTHLFARTGEEIDDGTRVRLEIGTIRKGVLIRGVAKVAGPGEDGTTVPGRASGATGLHLHLIHLDPASTRLVDSIVRGEIADVSAGETSGPSPFEIPSAEPEPTEPEAVESEPIEPEATEPEPGSTETGPESTASETEPESTESETETQPPEPESTESETETQPEPKSPEPEPAETEPTEFEPTVPEPETTRPDPTGPEPDAPEVVTEPAEPVIAATEARRLPGLGWALALALAALAGSFLLIFHLVTGRNDDQLLTGHDRRGDTATPAPIRDVPASDAQAGRADETAAGPGTSSSEDRPHAGATEPEAADPIRPPSDTVAVEIESVVFAWADAWSRQDSDAYIELYAADYSPDGLDRDTWERQRRSRITSPERLEVSISDLEVEVTDPERAIVRFHQLYATGDKALAARKMLELERFETGWKIVGERLQR